MPALVTGAEALPAEHAIICADGVVRSPDAVTSHVHARCIPFPSSAFTIGRRYAKRVAQAERHDDRSDPPIGRHTVESIAFCPETHRSGILARSPPQHRLEPAAIRRHGARPECCRCPVRRWPTGDVRSMRSNRSAYDHRLRDLVCRTRDLDLAERLGVPRSTAKSWLRRGVRPVVTSAVLDDDASQLRIRVLRLSELLNLQLYELDLKHGSRPAMDSKQATEQKLRQFLGALRDAGTEPIDIEVSWPPDEDGVVYLVACHDMLGLRHGPLHDAHAQEEPRRCVMSGCPRIPP